jgi:hypothetical protein
MSFILQLDYSRDHFNLSLVEVHNRAFVFYTENP